MAQDEVSSHVWKTKASFWMLFSSENLIENFCVPMSQTSSLIFLPSPLIFEHWVKYKMTEFQWYANVLSLSLLHLHAFAWLNELSILAVTLSRNTIVSCNFIRDFVIEILSLQYKWHLLIVLFIAELSIYEAFYHLWNGLSNLQNASLINITEAASDCYLQVASTKLAEKFSLLFFL